MTNTTSTPITIQVGTPNGGAYQISYERPGPVDRAAVLHDLVELGSALVDDDAEIGEVSGVLEVALAGLDYKVEALAKAIESVRSFASPPAPEHIVERANAFLAFLQQ